MTFKQWLRNAFGTQAKGSRAARRGKSRRATPYRYVPRLELLEDRLAPAILMVNSLLDNTTAGNGLVTLREAILASVNLGTTDLGVTGTRNDTIRFASAIDGGTISLTSRIATDVGPSAFQLGSTLVIDGQTGLNQGITIERSSAAEPFRFFYVVSTGNLTLQSLTVSGFIAQGFDGYNETYVNGSGGGGGASAGLGGAIYNHGNLTLQNSTLTGNTAAGGAVPMHAENAAEGSGGAGLGARGQIGGYYSNNYLYGGAGGGPNGGVGGRGPGGDPTGGNGGFGGGGGGGAYHLPMIGFSYAGGGGNGGFGGGGGGGSAPQDDDENAGNGGAGGFGGGGGGSQLEPLSGGGGTVGVGGPGGFGGGNGVGRAGGGGAGMGGAVFSRIGTVVISNSTFTGNTALGGAGGGGAGQGLGGGLFIYNSTLTIRNSTFSENTAAQGGRGIFIIANGPSTWDAVIVNTIIGQGDINVSDLLVGGIAGGLISLTGQNNLIRTSNVTLTGTVTGDPKLGPLQDNGGRTPTMALAANSPAIDAGTDAGLSTDQRGISRPQGLAVDIGAFEVLPTSTLGISSPTSAEGTGGTTTLTFTVTSSGAIPGGFTVAFSFADGSATASDYSVSTSSPLTFAGTASETQTISVTVATDAIVEANETFTITLGAVGGTTPQQAVAITTGAVGTGTINNDDGSTLAIDSPTVTEGTGGTKTLTFTVTSSGAVQGGFTVAFSAANGSATASDYSVSTSSPLTFAGTVGETQTISVAVATDAIVEANETFTITLAAVGGTTPVQTAAITTGAVGTGTINNDDVRFTRGLSSPPTGRPLPRSVRPTPAAPETVMLLAASASESQSLREVILALLSARRESISRIFADWP